MKRSVAKGLADRKRQIKRRLQWANELKYRRVTIAGEPIGQPAAARAATSDGRGDPLKDPNRPRGPHEATNAERQTEAHPDRRAAARPRAAPEA